MSVKPIWPIRQNDPKSTRVAVFLSAQAYATGFANACVIAGCSACKKKRMKCDETLPSCRNCTRRKIECPGYERQLKWSTKYERFRPSKPRQTVQVEPISSRFEKTANDPKSSHEQVPSQLQANRSKSVRDENSQQLPDNRDTSHPKEPIPASHGDSYEDQLPTPEEDHEIIDVSENVIPNDSGQCNIDIDPNAQSLYESNTLSRALAPRIDSYIHSAIWSYVSDHDDHAEKLVAHYFDVICQVMSCFDSASNPYRTDIPQSLSISPHIFDCLMTMSAAHMANYVHEYTVATLRYQTKAMSSLQDEMASLALTELATATSSKSRYQLLLGTIIIGMTSVILFTRFYHCSSSDF